MEAITNECIIKNMEMIKETYPSLSEKFLDILCERFKAHAFDDARVNNAVKGVIDNFPYNTPTIAHFILFDKEHPVSKIVDGSRWFRSEEDGLYRNREGKLLIE